MTENLQSISWSSWSVCGKACKGKTVPTIFFFFFQNLFIYFSKYSVFYKRASYRVTLIEQSVTPQTLSKQCTNGMSYSILLLPSESENINTTLKRIKLFMPLTSKPQESAVDRD